MDEASKAVTISRGWIEALPSQHSQLTLKSMHAWLQATHSCLYASICSSCNDWQ